MIDGPARIRKIPSRGGEGCGMNEAARTIKKRCGGKGFKRQAVEMGFIHNKWGCRAIAQSAGLADSAAGR